MPQSVQIVPKYLHSHVESYVNDYTQFNDETSTPSDDNTQFIAVFRSSMGIDNVLVKKDDLTDFKKTYGKSDYNKYGQPLMMPLAMLAGGNATVHCMRVMPDDAVSANSILTVMYKADPDTKKFQIKFSASYVSKDDAGYSTAFSSTAKAFKKYLSQRGQAMATTTDDGWTVLPLVTFRMAGRGIYGNKYRWRITRNYDYENDYGVKMYSFETLSTINGLEKIATYVGSLVTSSKHNSLTCINDILGEEEVGSVVMDVNVEESTVEAVHAAFKEFVESLDEADRGVVPEVDEFDIFFGTNIGETTTYANIEIINEVTDVDSVSVDRAQGISLAGGYDGGFGDDAKVSVTDANGNTVVYEGHQAVNMNEVQAFKNAFSGVYDVKILSTRRTPCTILLDANYPFEVKEALADLAIARNDCLCVIDAGTETTLAQIDNIISDYAGFNVRNISKEFQHYTVKDPDTKKKCEVTTTYFLAGNLATHYVELGSHIPFVKANAQLSGHIKNTLEPCIDDVALEEKEKLYVNRINYFETVEENVYQRASQNTAQMINSDLVEENNMNTLFILKQIIERDCWDNLYNFTSAADRQRFSEIEKAKFSAWIGVRVASLDIDFDVNAWEAERSIVHCYVSVQFRNLTKRAIIEIDVNKRDFLA